MTNLCKTSIEAARLAESFEDWYEYLKQTHPEHYAAHARHQLDLAFQHIRFDMRIKYKIPKPRIAKNNKQL